MSTKDILSWLDEGEGMGAVFRLHAAKWYDYCRLHYNKTKLRRAEKRRASLDDDPGALKSTGQSTEQALPSTEKCFFFDQSGGGAFRHASTFQLDMHVRQRTLKLQDKPLLAKLNAGDLIA